MVKKSQIFQLYRESSFLTKLYIRIKLKICPFLLVETFVPREGRVIDLGCGNGFFSSVLKLGSAARKITGFDLDRKKIQEAKALKKIWPWIDFQTGNIIEMDFPRANIFTLIDVLYLIPFAQQDDIIKRCHSSIEDGGYLIIKEMDTNPLWKYAWNFFQETLAVKVIGFTLGSRFYFRPEKEFSALLHDSGFKVTTVRLDREYWYPHILYICRKVNE